MLDARQLEPPLSRDEQLLRDKFVAQYLRDYDAYKACLRLGFTHAFALSWSERFMCDGYVQRAIAHMTAQPIELTDEQLKAQVQRRLVQIGMRAGDGASVSALRALNAMKGWDKSEGSTDSEQALIDAFKSIAEQLPT